jgi:hypothetical protein
MVNNLEVANLGNFHIYRKVPSYLFKNGKLKLKILFIKPSDNNHVSFINGGSDTDSLNRHILALRNFSPALVIDPESYLCGLNNAEVQADLNKDSIMIEIRKNGGPNHHGLFFLTENETEILNLKTKILLYLQKDVSSLISQSEILSAILIERQNSLKEKNN